MCDVAKMTIYYKRYCPTVGQILPPFLRKYGHYPTQPLNIVRESVKCNLNRKRNHLYMGLLDHHNYNAKLKSKTGHKAVM